MSTNNTKVVHEQGGNTLSIKSGGVLNIESGAQFQIAGADVTSSVAGSGVAGIAAGYKIARGKATLDGSNPTPVATGLTTIVAAVACLNGTGAPGVGTSVVTVEHATGGTLNLYAWKPTSNANPTLIASTGTEDVDWIAIGT